MKKTNQSQTRKKGFTLIELSIVLVIIGLIVGGVLVGQDLIKAAEIRATVGQTEKYSAAVNTFRGKYNGMPGDLLNAGTFGLANTSQGSTTGLGNGNGLIEGSCSWQTQGGGETFMFWRHLAQANLIADSITAVTSYACAGAVIDDTYLPLAKMGKGNRFAVTSTNGLNYFMMAGITSAATTTGQYTGNSSLTPLEAYQIDGKLDDGLPASGLVASIRMADPGTLAGGASTPAATDCYDSDAPAVYAMSTNASGLACQLRIRSSF